MKNCTPLWREADFQVKMHTTHQRRTTFGSSDVEKNARHRGAKYIFKSKVKKETDGVGPLFDVHMLKKCTPLWREAHFEVKSEKVEGFEPFLTLRCQKESTLTNLTNSTHIADLTNFTNLTYLSYFTYLNTLANLITKLI